MSARHHSRPERDGDVAPGRPEQPAATPDGGWSERTVLGGPRRVTTPRPRSSRSGAQINSPGPDAARTDSARAGKAKRPRSIPFAVLLVGVVAAGMSGLLALNTATAASEVRERRVDAVNSSLSAKQEQLSRAVADMQAPAELARLATRLGLVPAGSAAFLRVNADGTVTVLGAPAKVPAPVIPLTPAQKAAATAAKAAAAKAKAAKEKAANAAKAKAATAAKATAAGKAGQITITTPKTTAARTGTTSSRASAGTSKTSKATKSSKTTKPSKTTKAKTPKPTTPKPTTPKATTPKATTPKPTKSVRGGLR